MKRLAALLPALVLTACAPQALFFHETTKVAFAAHYNTADSQPMGATFGFKRRIVAVVPAQERVLVDGSERRATNEKEALSIVSKFHVRVGTFQEGVVITNNFASGTAARIMTRSPNSAATLNALLHNEPIEVSPTTGETRTGQPAAAAVNQRIDGIMAKRFRAPADGSSRGRIDAVQGGTTRSGSSRGAGKKPAAAEDGTSRGRIDTVPGQTEGKSRGRIDTVPPKAPRPAPILPAGDGESGREKSGSEWHLPRGTPPATAPGRSRGVIHTPADAR